jgi:hypothetical protein
MFLTFGASWKISRKSSLSSTLIYLEKCGGNIFLRDQPWKLAILTGEEHPECRARSLYFVSMTRQNLGLPPQQRMERDAGLVIASRIGVIQICLLPGLRSYKARPLSHFDSKDWTVI